MSSTPSAHRPVESGDVSAVGEVETSDAVGVVRGSVETLPPEMYLRASPLAQANAALREFAEGARRGAADTLERLHPLMGAIHNELAVGAEVRRRAPAAEAFALKKGGAADFAHVFVACARWRKFPRVSSAATA